MTTAVPYRHPPLLTVTPTDHTAWIVITAILGICCALVTALLRIFVRAVISPPFGHDDTVVLVATLFATLQSAIVVYGASQGLGKSIHLVSLDGLQALQKAAYASDILYLITTYLSKCSVILLLLRLSQDRKHRLIFHATLGATVVVGLALIFAISLRCDLSRPWLIYQEKCPGILLRWQVETAFDTFGEAIIFAISFYLVQGLHMSLSNKFIIVGVFAFRILLIPFLVVRVISFPQHHLSTDPSFTLTYFYIWTQTVLNLSLIVSTTPCLKPFVASLNTGYGAFDSEHVATRVYGDTYGSSGNHHNGSYPRQAKITQSRGRWGSKLASGKSIPKSNVDDRSRSIVGRVAGHISKAPKAAASDEPGAGNATILAPNHQRQPNQFDAAMSLAPGVDASRQELRGGEGQAVTHTHSASAVAQDGNSIGSNDSRQMIIRKDMTWAVEYSDPTSHAR
ncbi:MAG: hypothetical protein Q9215_005861 [Flavoplaca cf. flavocitrina]